jgi:hypothetical protein
MPGETQHSIEPLQSHTFLLTFNDSFTIFSIASVDINKIMVIFYHLLVCPWISVFFHLAISVIYAMQVKKV